MLTVGYSSNNIYITLYNVNKHIINGFSFKQLVSLLTNKSCKLQYTMT